MAGKLKREYYLGDNVVSIARSLLGKTLMTNIKGVITGGKIIETEAYSGLVDKASHAWPNKKTARTEVMFEPGGIAYVYLCYGIHRLFNIVTNVTGKPDAVLVRAIEPTVGIEHIIKRRNAKKLTEKLSSGPAKVSLCLGIDLDHNTQPLTGRKIWIENGIENHHSIVETTRIGVDYAGEDALLPWRFYIKDNSYISRK
jgi:DNA-3-methyladenine glycosylase